MMLFYIILLLLFTSTGSVAQTWGTSLGTPVQSSNSAAPSSDRGDLNSVVLSGRVVVKDGISLPDLVAIELDCKGNTSILGYTDSAGHFDFVLNASDSSAREKGYFPYSSLTFAGCELQAHVPGFISQRVLLSQSLDFTVGSIRVGDVAIYPTRREAGNTISATEAAAPGKAKKCLQKGREQASKGKWKAAAADFQEAVHIYPKYARAWVYLGKVELQEGNIETARRCFQEALKADSGFVEAYAQLTQLALRSKQWQELADDTDNILRLDPVGKPQFWYLNSAAYYELRNIDKAEKSAMQGLRADAGERVPRLQYLLGIILTVKHEYGEAAEHIRHYLRLAPHADDAAIAEKQLHELEKLSGGAE